jgi:hypothetical protein
MTRSSWITLIAALVGLALAVYFAPDIWFAIKWIAVKTGRIIVILWTAFAAAVAWFWGLLGSALKLALPFLTTVVAFVIVAAAFALGIGFLAILSLMLAGYIGGKIKEIGQQVRELRVEFRVESGRTARDAAFMTLVATLCALIAYMGTEEFLKHISTVRFLAVSCIGLVAAKLFLLLPSRIPKLSGIFLTIVILVGSTVFVAIRYELAKGFANLSNAVTNPENELKLLLAVMVALFSLLTLLFPFTRTEWRQLLAVHRPEVPDLNSAKLSQIGTTAQQDRTPV